MRILGTLFLIVAMQPAPAQKAARAPGVTMASLVRQHRWHEVSSLAGSVAQKNPQDSVASYWLGYSELELQHYIPAEQAFRRAQILGLNNSALHEGLGLAYYRLNQFILFEHEMSLAAYMDPRDSTPDYYLGLYQLTIRSNIPQALRLLDKAAALKPDDWKVLYEQGNCWEKQGQVDKARPYYLRSADAAEKYHQNFGWPFQGLARLARQSNPRAALAYAKKAVQLEPQEYSNHLVLARTWSDLGETAEAIKEAREAASENRTDTESRYLLFRLYLRAGDRQAAARQLQTFNELRAAYDTQ